MTDTSDVYEFTGIHIDYDPPGSGSVERVTVELRLATETDDELPERVNLGFAVSDGTAAVDSLRADPEEASPETVDPVPLAALLAVPTAERAVESLERVEEVREFGDMFEDVYEGDPDAIPPCPPTEPAILRVSTRD